MADLIDRLAFHEELTGRPKISVHQFIGYLTLYALGLRTRSEIATSWDLQGEEATQAGYLADQIDAASGAEKQVIALKVDAIALLLEMRDPSYVDTGQYPPVIDKTAVKADLGIV